MSELDLDKKKNKTLDPVISKKFKSIGFETLTEIQRIAIPKILEEKNCLIIAPTGSGKTECATIPIFSKLKNRKILNKIKAAIKNSQLLGKNAIAKKYPQASSIIILGLSCFFSLNSLLPDTNTENNVKIIKKIRYSKLPCGKHFATINATNVPKKPAPVFFLNLNILPGI